MKKKEQKVQKKQWLNGKQIRRRSLAVTLCFSTLLGLLCIRVGYIQFVKGEEYQKLASSQQTATRVITAKRGMIYDRNGNTLAISTNVYRVSINPRDIRKDLNRKDNIEAHQKYVAEQLSALLGMEYAEVYKKVMKTNAYQEIKRQVENDVIQELKKWISAEKIFGVYIDDDAKRYYPNQKLGSHVIGFTNTDQQGMAGIELMYNEYLTGKDGYIISEVDRKRENLPIGEEVVKIEPEHGKNIVLTIDATIQNLVEESLRKTVKEMDAANGGVCIVMDPKTGNILAMASNPDFNLNEPFAFPDIIGEQQIQKLTQQYQWDKNKWNGRSENEIKVLNEIVWRNKVISDTYEPGSTFKAITAAILLEEGTVTKDTEVLDAPYTVGGANPINCWRKQNHHGKETFAQAVWNSCNPVFAEFSIKLGKETYYKYIDAFGFQSKTGVTFPGEASSIFHADPTNLDLAVTSFGQRFQVTPLQIATAYCALANGGELLVPKLVKEVVDSKGTVIEKAEKEVVRQVVSKETSQKVVEILRGVVTKGTGSNANKEGLRIAGKTGTAETIIRDDRHIVSFAAIAPADDPQLVLLYAMDYPKDAANGSANICRASGDLAEKIMDYMGIERIPGL